MTLPRNWRAWLAFAYDLAAAALAWTAVYLLRFNLDFREPYLADMAWTLAWIVPLQGAILLTFGLYRGLWRFASLLDLQRIVLAAGLGALLIPLGLVMFQLQAVVPRTVLIDSWGAAASSAATRRGRKWNSPMSVIASENWRVAVDASKLACVASVWRMSASERPSGTAIRSASGVGCMPRAVRTNSSSFIILRRRASAALTVG